MFPVSVLTVSSGIEDAREEVTLPTPCVGEAHGCHDGPTRYRQEVRPADVQRRLARPEGVVEGVRDAVAGRVLRRVRRVDVGRVGSAPTGEVPGSTEVVVGDVERRTYEAEARVSYVKPPEETVGPAILGPHPPHTSSGPRTSPDPLRARTATTDSPEEGRGQDSYNRFREYISQLFVVSTTIGPTTNTSRP